MIGMLSRTNAPTPGVSGVDIECHVYSGIVGAVQGDVAEGDLSQISHSRMMDGLVRSAATRIWSSLSRVRWLQFQYQIVSALVYVAAGGELFIAVVNISVCGAGGWCTCTAR